MLEFFSPEPQIYYKALIIKVICFKHRLVMLLFDRIENTINFMYLHATLLFGNATLTLQRSDGNTINIEYLLWN